MRGRTINIYIPDSNPRGVKICDLKDSIVKAIFIPRSKLDEVSKRTDILDPGIYFLIGKEDELEKPQVYIGEAENLLSRIKQHNAGKDFWNTAICFVSEKKNINKAHIKYLENHACSQAKQINKCKLENCVNPTQSSLTESDIDFVLSFFDDIKILIATLGFPIFEESKKEKQNLFICKGKDAYAEGEYSEDGMTVFKGSKANLIEPPSIGKTASNLRKVLLQENIIKKVDNVLIFDEDYTFTSPSTASDVVLAASSNGWDVWKDKEGKTLDERFRRK
ncbi:MAG: hypothetical protein UR28_C0039G0029 [Candidatus Peregrinibacteria bacterium GW2011_GWF2_33_10]|nr:MAG: hypothetical protein UR28_C0039G0029 [Candidatus Peregrinibacteria bacterium GW2011_GWF2_33_10]OGJ45932.1 MAG: hypothetical protein A2263_02225 [Candidatus Peregrinibacteria bacterium RIFOXYA2_FULL_33_21]OGJ46610.1 MAG: hypothetical protein A2272_02895 [Candidatus Peregrinibacteria bacterium RIFOXYA12_FULL_33_12]OGJ51522.1 MAG: hypothetical protein A2307_01010 [Candidatus Peregrinibacteria bacterium RIFOXYB2_FULL_33_20]